jgi:DNA polymerase I-like protein with 3'-5' exonuclease and polymerase domains
LDGRQIQIEKEHTILVYLLQSDEAIQMAAAYCWFQIQMEKRGYEYGKDYGMLIWMHDEYQFECKPEIVEYSSRLAKDSISWAGRFYKIRCPHEGEIKIGNNWKETH